MAKYRRKGRLHPREKEDLIIEFCEALVAVKTTREAVSFVKDILTEQEIEMLAKRLRIARLLLEGKTYNEIEEKLGVSFGTVARVSEWLRLSGAGYQMIVKRVKKKDHYMKDHRDADYGSRRFSLYCWPELLIEDLVRRADKSQRENIREAIKTVGEKSALYKRLDKLVQESFKTPKVGML